jgi:uncharacterized protein YecE (DUF72 family)
VGEILIGTAGWAERTLLDSGWYPPQVDTPQKRLAYYAERFPLVEVDSTYYAPPAEATARLWAARTPPGFTFNVKAFSLLTGHPTQPGRLYRDLRPQTTNPQTAKKNIYPDDLAPHAYEQVWSRFLGALEPLREAGKLGLLLFQFPPWFTVRHANKQHLLEVAERCQPLRIAVELRHRSWFAGDNATETLDFLRQHHLPYVCVDMPQGYPSSVPPIVAATSDLAVIRFHGHSEHWTSRDIQEKYGYLYPEQELRSWVPRLTRLAGQATSTHVLMNNCRGDAAQVNAAQLRELLGR